MKKGVKKIPIVKLLALSIIVFTILWYIIESRTKTTKPVTNNPSQWNQPQNSLSVSDDGLGNVTFTAEYLRDQNDDESLTLKVYLNTHSVDLSSVDFQNDIYLDKDGKIVYPQSVNTEGSTHHREAELTFEKIEFPFKVVGENIGQIQKREIAMDIPK